MVQYFGGEEKYALKKKELTLNFLKKLVRVYYQQLEELDFDEKYNILKFCSIPVTQTTLIKFGSLISTVTFAGILQSYRS
jgi:hypothetical protein